jgi:hypothetical protein
MAAGERLTGVLGVALAWLLCSGFDGQSVPQYAVSVPQVEAIRASSAAIALGTFTGEQKSVSCRATDIVTPTGGNFADYIHDALRDELTLAGIAPANAVPLSGILQNIDASCGMSDGLWTIAVQIVAGNSAPVTITVSHKFEGAFIGLTVYNNALAAFVPAVQDLLDAILKSPALHIQPQAVAAATSSAVLPAKSTASLPVPQTIASVSPPTVSSEKSSQDGNAGKQVAVVMKETCLHKPSAATFMLDQDEDDCDANALEAIRGKIGAALAGKGVSVGAGEAGAGLTLAVTMTANIYDTDTAVFDTGGIARVSADYTLTDSTGSLVKSGAVNYQSGDDDDEGVWEQHFADELAGDVAMTLQGANR